MTRGTKRFFEQWCGPRRDRFDVATPPGDCVGPFASGEALAHETFTA
ncbi:MAG: hypothetical protein H0W23_03020 [Chloroflexia bacterium]|nr:hypothetical protein [Chloroflexia bacterium]